MATRGTLPVAVGGEVASVGVVRRARRINRALADIYPDAQCELD
ncbi:MAG: endonuclease III, partial [Actinobacteria bacterium HGW-Actinobacteria-8]